MFSYISLAFRAINLNFLVLSKRKLKLNLLNHERRSKKIKIHRLQLLTLIIMPNLRAAARRACPMNFSCFCCFKLLRSSSSSISFISTNAPSPSCRTLKKNSVRSEGQVNRQLTISFRLTVLGFVRIRITIVAAGFTTATSLHHVLVVTTVMTLPHWTASALIAVRLRFLATRSARTLQ